MTRREGNRREYGSWKQALEIAGYRLTKGSHKNANQIFNKDEAPTQASSNVAQAV